MGAKAFPSTHGTEFINMPTEVGSPLTAWTLSYDILFFPQFWDCVSHKIILFYWDTMLCPKWQDFLNDLPDALNVTLLWILFTHRCQPKMHNPGNHLAGLGSWFGERQHSFTSNCSCRSFYLFFFWKKRTPWHKYPYSGGELDYIYITKSHALAFKLCCF